MHAAVLTERVLCRPGIELVRGQLVLAAQQLEAFRRHDQMQNSFLGAYRAVAIAHGCKIGRDAEPHAAAVAAAFHGPEHPRCLRDHPARRPRSSSPFPRQTSQTAPDRARVLRAQDDGTRATSTVDRARCAISFAPSAVMPMPRTRAPRLTISSSSLSE